METELEQDQEATTALYLNESTQNITSTGMISHKGFRGSVCDHFCCDDFTSFLI